MVSSASSTWFGEENPAGNLISALILQKAIGEKHRVAAGLVMAQAQASACSQTAAPVLQAEFQFPNRYWHCAVNYDLLTQLGFFCLCLRLHITSRANGKSKKSVIAGDVSA